jgi:membrane-bound serine protease (ClpP class)
VTGGRILPACALALALALPALAAKPKPKAPADSGPQAAPQRKEPSGPRPRVLVAPFSGVISPVAAEFIVGAVERAAAERDDAVLVELDTPGGLDLSMREIIKAILSSKVPVIVYVYPTGGRAASAGVFITVAAHVAAMAPGTNIGAAHPVSLPSFGGAPEKQDKTMEGKVVNDAAAYIKSIAEKRGRNAAWAEQAVTQSTSIPASEALSLGVIDAISPDPAQLLRDIDGRKLADFKAPLRTADAVLEPFPMSRRQKLLATISDPNVAMILMSLGAGGLFIELYNPGLILPGIVGGISLILAFYSFQTLSASYAGVLLIMLGMVFFLLEIKVTSYGLLALGGIAAVLLGVLMLFQNSLGGLGVSWTVLGSSLAGVLAAVGGATWLVWRAGRRRVETGSEGMIGAGGRVFQDLSPKGRVTVGGEIWEAESVDGDIPKDADVVVVEARGLHLKVRRK